MNYGTNGKIIERSDSSNSLRFLLFWGLTNHERITKSCLSQWCKTNFEVNAVVYETTKHFIMAEKSLLFNDRGIYEQGIKCSKAREEKVLGTPRIWEENRLDVVVRGTSHRYSQNRIQSKISRNTNYHLLNQD